MVYNTTRMVKLPHHNSSIFKSLSAGAKQSAIHGTGTGSVLLSTGGGGAASSYMDIDDYIATTGINPYARSGVSRPQGRGINSKLASQLSKLNVNTIQPLRKNIVMSM
jgi:hypothetical protein